MKLSESEVVILATKSFVLEAITDKPGCTSRYTDLPDKPLQDFLIAGINSSPYFGLLARDFYQTKNMNLFDHNISALKASNIHKSAKFVNFGLLEIMFPVVYARLKTADQNAIVDEVINAIKHTTNKDVQVLLKTRKLAWSTSTKSHKVSFDASRYDKSPSVWDFYQSLYDDFDEDTSQHQWAKQYQIGLPILAAFYNNYRENNEVVNSTKKTFERLKKQYPYVPVGILADMCAAAIFLWLSFNTKQV